MDIVVPLVEARAAGRQARTLAALIALTALGLALQASAQPRAPGASVDELLALARERTPELAAMSLEADAVAERIGPAAAFPDPMFRVELQGINAGNVASTKYTVLQTFPWFGKRELRRTGAEADAEAARRRVDEAWSEVAMRVKSSFAQHWQVVHTERLVSGVLDLMQRLQDVAQARYSSGLAAQQDAIRAQTERAAMEGELIMLAGERRRSVAALNAALARPVNAALAEPERLRVVPPPASLDIDALSDRLAGRNPTLAVEDARISSAERARDLAYRNRFPDFSFGVSPIQMGSRLAEWEFMVEVAIPLQQQTRRSQEREAERMREAALARRTGALVRLQGELGATVAALEAARQTEMLISGRLLPLAQLNFESALAGYENGKVDFATLLEAQRQIRKARQDVIKAQAEQQMRLAEVERIVGEDL